MKQITIDTINLELLPAVYGAVVFQLLNNATLQEILESISDEFNKFADKQETDE